MGRTKELLQEDWEREWEKDFVYLLEEQRRAEMELYSRQPAEIVVINKTKSKKKDESNINILPF